jgi:acyl-coenzyme A synthetase/AMP-(fatty) acid ligase
MTYPLNRNGSNKSCNGILCIGKPMQNSNVTIVDEQMRPVEMGEKGELCLSGPQVSPGYWKNPSRNEKAFITLENTRYYRTGDQCFADENGDVFYTGRIDFQVKIQGFRVELGEIEQRAREFLKTHAVIAVARQNESTTWQIFLFIENHSGPVNPVHVHLKKTLPSYMLPAKVLSVPQFPLNSNGKIDRKALLEMLG